MWLTLLIAPSVTFTQPVGAVSLGLPRIESPATSWVPARAAVGDLKVNAVASAALPTPLDEPTNDGAETVLVEVGLWVVVVAVVDDVGVVVVVVGVGVEVAVVVVDVGAGRASAEVLVCVGSTDARLVPMRALST